MEKDGEVAILLAHVPLNKDDCSFEFSIRVKALIERF
jgi:hypothetical protein